MAHCRRGASQPGPAIYAVWPLTLNGVGVSGNRETGSDAAGQSVGAITALNTLTITASTITDNHATAGTGPAGGIGGESVAAILPVNNFQVTITRSTISNNTAVSGNGGDNGLNTGGPGGNAYGAIFDEDADPITITGSTITGNTAQAGDGGSGSTGGAGGSAFGGGVIAPDGTLHITSTTFAKNTVTAGRGGTGTVHAGTGGVALGAGVGGGSRTGDNSILNSTFSGNVARAGAAGTGPNGTSGFAAGGGLAENTTHSLSVISSTFSGNVATSPDPSASYGGNLYDQPTIITLAQNIFTGGVAATGPDCAINGSTPGQIVEHDLGHNLATRPAGCGMSAANHDLLGLTAALLPLADNGGGVPTMALTLAPRSAAIGAAGSCRDYTTAGAPALTTDERGAPRTAPCDIGAFQTGAAPPVSSTTTTTSSATTTPSTTTTTTSSAATASTTSTAATDSTTSTGATDSTTSATATSTATTTPGPPPPKGVLVLITHVSQQSARWRIAGRHRPTRGRSVPIPTGTSFRFSLSSAARVTLSFTGPGRKTHTISLGQLAAGAHLVRFSGHLPHGVTLAPGSYTVRFNAGPGPVTPPTALQHFTIVR